MQRTRASTCKLSREMFYKTGRNQNTLPINPVSKYVEDFGSLSFRRKPVGRLTFGRRIIKGEMLTRSSLKDSSYVLVMLYQK